MTNTAPVIITNSTSSTVNLNKTPSVSARVICIRELSEHDIEGLALAHLAGGASGVFMTPEYDVSLFRGESTVNVITACLSFSLALGDRSVVKTSKLKPSAMLEAMAALDEPKVTRSFGNTRYLVAFYAN